MTEKLNGHLITKAEFARRWGVSKPYISKIVKAGQVLTKGGKIDIESGDAFMASRSVHRSASLQGQGDPEAQDASRRLKAAQAGLAELDLKKMRGELIERGEVERTAAQAANVLKQALATRNRRLGAKFGREVLAILEESDRELLTEFSRGLAEF